MRQRRSEVYFYERIGVLGYIASAIKNREIYYCSQSFFMRALKRLFFVGWFNRAKIISYGDLQKVTDIRKTAYESAIKKIDEIDPKTWDLRLVQSLTINNELIVEKYLLQLLFEKYEFYGLVRQYSRENPSHSVKVLVDPLFFNSGLFGQSSVKVVKLFNFRRIGFFVSMVSLPIYLLYFVTKNKKEEAQALKNSIVCEVDGRVVIDMFRDLLDGYRNLHLVAKRGYFKKTDICELGLTVHGINSVDRRLLREIGSRALSRALKNGVSFSKYGKILFELCQMYAHGVLCTPDARDGAYLTFEHLSVEKAVRNEILRARGNKSIFIPYNIYTSSPFYAPEYRLNYDVLCSPGELCERAYVMQRAVTNIVLPTSSYHANKRVMDDDGAPKRVKSLSEFRGDSVAITILCNGVQDLTLSGEVRLMALARRLAGEPNVKIFIRQKPVQPPAEFRDFYQGEVGGHESILLTHSEYELYDFLGVTDLFVTSNSSSVLEFCAAGSDFFSVNFWDRTDFFLWQTAVEGVYLDEHTAFDQIMAWVRDFPVGQRAAHKRRMEELSGLLSYKFDNFESYKKNFQFCLNPYLPQNALPS